ncbi:hypothetical protein BY458DRAFT_499964 [Sporodiniella umbellata]|nr:hypothetical protein BY458DRAFT_499964 [Sporodiniella umbellata]
MPVLYFSNRIKIIKSLKSTSIFALGISSASPILLYFWQPQPDSHTMMLGESIIRYVVAQQLKATSLTISFLASAVLLATSRYVSCIRVHQSTAIIETLGFWTSMKRTALPIAQLGKVKNRYWLDLQNATYDKKFVGYLKA